MNIQRARRTVRRQREPARLIAATLLIWTMINPHINAVATWSLVAVAVSVLILEIAERITEPREEDDWDE